MKKVLSIALLLIVATTIQAQSCKYSTDKTDPITGKRTLGARLKINYFFEIGFTRVGDDYRLDALVCMAGDQRNILPAGTTLDLKLANGKVIIAASLEESSPIAYVTSAQVFSAYAMSYTITAQQAKDIAAAGIKYSKAHLMAENYYEHTYREGETEKSRLRASCVYLGTPPVVTAIKPNSAAQADDNNDYKEGESIIEELQRKKKAKEEAVKAPAAQPAASKPVAATTPSTAPTETKAAPTATQATKTTTPAANTPPVIVTTLSGADELMKWKKLLDDGVITKEEFDVQKKKILEAK